MKQEKTASSYRVNWWLWNGKTFEQHELEVESVEIAKCRKYRFFRAANPVKNAAPDRRWLIAEGGTGYVLAYGPNSELAFKTARARFQFEKEGIRPADVGCYIQSHLALLERYVGHLSGFVRPVVGENIRTVLEPGEFLIAQMI